MNRIILVGRLTKDPEIKKIEESDRFYTRFIIAVDRGFKNSEGEIGTDYIPIVFWGKKAEIVSKYFAKGRLISLSGVLQTRSYEDKDGIKRYVAEVLADEFRFVDHKRTENFENQG